MKRIVSRFWVLIALLMLGFHGHALAGSKPVEVAVTNYTSNQPFSPPVCVVHDGTFVLYELGQTASAGLKSIAEDALSGDLQDMVDSSASAKVLVEGDGVILPGHTGSVIVDMDKKDFVSCVWMLVKTNDTFAAITDVSRPKKREVLRFHVIGLDAGTEQNDELMANIPGFSGENHKGEPEEGGVVLGARGIQGNGDVTDIHDWRGYVARVIVERQ